MTNIANDWRRIRTVFHFRIRQSYLTKSYLTTAFMRTISRQQCPYNPAWYKYPSSLKMHSHFFSICTYTDSDYVRRILLHLPRNPSRKRPILRRPFTPPILPMPSSLPIRYKLTMVMANKDTMDISQIPKPLPHPPRPPSNGRSPLLFPATPPH